MLSSLFWSVFVRVGQTAIEASTTLLIGLFVAAVLRRMLGAAGTRKLFGGEGLAGLFRAWVIGSLLPVCSLGVIPVARELRRAGVPSSTILAFLLAAPQLNPLSFLYGLTLSDPKVILCYVAGTMAMAIVGGEVWKRYFERPQDNPPPHDEAMPAPGPKRLASVLVAASRDAVSSTFGYVALGIAFTGLVAGLIPHGALGTSMRHDDPTSPLLMALVGVPAYSGVLPGMMRIGLMFEHGNSVGASWVLFELGVGLNVGLLLWLCHQYGSGRALRWLGAVVAMVIALAYVAEPLLYSAHEEASHTHAFDDWASPFGFGDDVPWQVARDKLLQKIEVLEPVSLGGLAVLFLLGGLLRRFDPGERVEAWLTTETPASGGPVAVWNRPVPGPVLGLVTLAGLVVFSVVALFIYYPAPDDVFKEVTRVRADAFSAVRSKNKEEAIRQLELWDLLTRKLQVGVFLRTGRLDPEAAKLAEDLRERLEEMRDALLAGDVETANNLLPQAEAAYRLCRAAFRPAQPGSAAEPG